MQGIFISYRREDSAGYAGRLYDRLVSHFGAERVFMDVEGIEPGVDFVEALDQAVASCEVLIVIIGPEWLATDKAGKRRLDDPKDFVHIETKAALARQIRVVPVLVDGAEMPREDELPADLAKLTRRQAVELSHKHWDATSAELIRTLGRADTRRVRHYWVIGGMVALAATAVGIYLTLPWEEPAKPVPQAERPAVVPPTDTVVAKAPEKAAPPAEKPPAPSEEKAAPPSVAKTEAPAPAPKRPAETTPAPAPKKPAETASIPAPKKAAEASPAPAPKKAAETATAPAPSGKVAGAAPAPPVEKPSTPVTAPPATTPPATAPPVTPPVATTAALPTTLPRVGDTWEYRMRSKWPTVQPRTYTHRVTAVSAREVAQTISVDTNPDAAARQSFTPDTRFVEWRGQGFYLLEFNPFLEAFGGLQNTPAPLKVPAMPAENPMQADWYGQGRIRGYESVNVPAGTFKALKVEIDSNRRPTEGGGMSSREPVRAILTIWYAPEVKRTVKMLRVVMAENGMHLDEDTYELVRYRGQ